MKRISPTLSFCLLVTTICAAAVSAVAGPFASSGGGGGVAGADTQITFNDAGTAAGNAGLTFNKTNKALTLGGATVTASAPVLDLSQTWNAGAVTFTGLKLNVTNTASAAASLLADLQVGGVSKFQVKANGDFGFSPAASNGVSFTANNGVLSAAAGGYLAFANNRVYIGDAQRNVMYGSSGWMYAWASAASLGFGDSAGGATKDTALARPAAGVVEINNGTAATYTGTALLLGPQTVAQLPAAAAGIKGARATVTDATTTTFMGALTGGGANIVPVFCNGTAWVIG